jgi:hypothetical protein
LQGSSSCDFRLGRHIVTFGYGLNGAEGKPFAGSRV